MSAQPFRQNLLHALHRQFGPGHKDKHLAAALKIDRSTVNRLRHGLTPPTAERLEALSRYFGVAVDAWGLSADEFARAYDRRCDPQNGHDKVAARHVSMSTIVTSQHLWADSFAIHRGQYVAYWKAYGIEGVYVGSLVEIGGLDAGGMRFSMVNPYIRDDVDNDAVRSWRYEGVAYPVADYLYFYGEQVNGTYELFTMIVTASPLNPPDLLRGCLLGIYVKDGRKQIAVNVAIVLVYVPGGIPDWKAEIGRRLGKLPAGKLPERVRRLLDSYPGVIPVL